MKSKMHTIIIICISLLFTIPLKAQSDRVLVFSKTEGFRHKSIEVGILAIQKLGKENDFDVIATEDATYFNNDTLGKYNAIIFLSTSGTIFNKLQKNSFKSFVQSGGGFVGIHSATTTEYDWPWYGKLIGAYFTDHPKPQQATINILNTRHLATRKLPKKWFHFDEWYNFRAISEDIKILANLDETSYTGGKNGKNHPISWCQVYDGGKMFYTALGHTKEAYSDGHFLNHILGGIKYVLGRTE